MTLTIPDLTDLLRFLFVAVRLSAILLPLPFLGARMVPSQLKVIFVLVMSLSVYPAVQNQPVPIPLGPVHLGVLVCSELCLGLLIGFVALVLFSGIQLGGELMNQQMGLGIASLLNPESTEESTLITNFQYITAILVFFAGSGHHWFFHAMAESVQLVPLLHFSASPTLLTTFVALCGQASVAAVKIAAPLVITVLLTNIAMGVVARLVPQMNVFVLDFPLIFGVGLLALWCALPYVLGAFRTLFTQLGGNLLTMLRLLGGG
jgi:flagellar biosynthetic protein FliR